MTTPKKKAAPKGGGASKLNYNIKNDTQAAAIQGGNAKLRQIWGTP